MISVLFVDDEQRILDGLRRQLRSLRRDWAMEFQPSGPEALAVMTERSFDVVVSDMKMPGMDGAEFLSRVREEHPETVRIVLSGHADRDAIIETVAPAHQFLAKPCDAETLRCTISRSCTLRRVLKSERLQALVSGLGTLPSLPEVYEKVNKALEDEDVALADVGRLVGQDIGMTAQVLKVVNSAFFGMSREVTDVQTAISYLGLDTLKALVLSAGVFRQFEDKELEPVSLDVLWSHSLHTARLARALSKVEGLPKAEANEVFTAAMMHEVGKLVLVSGVPEEYKKVLALQAEGELGASAAEREILGANHGEVGGYLMGLWGLPESIVEGVAFHFDPGQSEENLQVVELVHVADCFANVPWEEGADPASYPIQWGVFERSGRTDKVTEWGRQCAAVEGTDV